MSLFVFVRGWTWKSNATKQIYAYIDIVNSPFIFHKISKKITYSNHYLKKLYQVEVSAIPWHIFNSLFLLNEPIIDYPTIHMAENLFANFANHYPFYIDIHIIINKS